MISKPSFLDFLVECLKRYTGVIIVSLFLHISYIIDFAMARQGVYLLSGDDKLGPQNTMIFNITIIMAVISGLQGFAYLHSEKQSLMFLGLPLKRGHLFLYEYVCGIVTAVIPGIVSRIICIFLLKEGQQNGLFYVAAGILVNILGFLLVYHLVILALVLTGKIWAALAGTAIALIYGTHFIGFVIEKYCAAFFSTYYKVDIVSKLTTYLSPKELYAKLAGLSDYSVYDNWSITGREADLAVMAVAVVLTGIAAVLLFHSRPAESAGKILSYKKSWVVVKIMLQIPLAMIVGYYIMSLSRNDRSIPFLFSGILLGIFLLNGLSGRKVLLSNMLQVMGIAIASIGIAAGFVYDLWNFDSFLPASDDIESVAVSIAGVETTSLSKMDILADYDADSRLSAMDLTEQNKINALEWIDNIRSNGNNTAITFVSVAYKYHDSRIKYRRYAITKLEQIEQFSKIYESEEYQNGTIPLSNEEKSAGQSFLWSNGVETYHLDFSDSENQELLNCYHDDLDRLSIGQVIESGSPIGLLELTRWNEENGRIGYIYPSFDNTIGYLQEQGINAGKTIRDYEVLKVEIQDQNGKSDDFETDGEIEAIKTDLICEELLINPVLVPVSDKNVTVKCSLGNERIYIVRYCKIFEKQGL